MELNIRKRKGIDRLVSEYSPGKVEEEKEIIADGGEIKNMLSKFNEYLDSSGFFPNSTLIEKITDVLPPNQINSLLQLIALTRPNAPSTHLGRFFSKLIENSYQAGHNYFFLNAQSFHQLDSFCNNIQGQETEPFRLFVKGDLEFSLRWMNYCHVQTEGYLTFDCAAHAKNSTFIIEGEVMDLPANTQYCTFKTTDANIAHAFRKCLPEFPTNKVLLEY